VTTLHRCERKGVNCELKCFDKDASSIYFGESGKMILALWT